MAHLFTHHDPFHMHKCLGLFVLLHFVYRAWCVFVTGTAFPPSEPRAWSSLCLVLQACLSWSSLLLPLPSKRNFCSPMIWPEFRLHSITFATRHVLCTLLTLHDAWPSGVWCGAAAKLCVLLCTSCVAGRITAACGDRARRTTNAMPYPASFTDASRDRIKLQYVHAQFAATHGCTLADATLNWVPLLAIQLSPFLMTLVRKGKITSFTYHRVYALCLWLGYVVSAVRVCSSSSASQLLHASLCMLCVRHLRLRWGFSPVSIWCFYVWCAHVCQCPWPACQGRWLWWLLLPTVVRQAWVYASLLIIQY